MNEIRDDPLLIIGPDKIAKWLLEYNSWCEDIDYRWVSQDGVLSQDWENLVCCVIIGN